MAKYQLSIRGVAVIAEDDDYDMLWGYLPGGATIRWDVKDLLKEHIDKGYARTVAVYNDKDYVIKLKPSTIMYSWRDAENGRLPQSTR